MSIDYKAINQIDMSDFIFTSDTKKYLFLAMKDKVDYVYNTAALEGNAMTYPEVETLLDGITVGGHKLSDEQQVLNQNNSVDLLFSLLKEDLFTLDKNTLCSLHKKVAKEEALSWGLFRDANVNIGGTEYLPPDHMLLNDIFFEGLQDIGKIKHPAIKAFVYFLFGARSQFFFDGNKRTSRLMMNGILLQSGYPLLNIKAKDKLEFNIMMIKFYDSCDYILGVNYLLNYYIAHNKHLS